MQTLGFGTVILQSKNSQTHQFFVSGLKELFLICLLFNGNMVFPMRHLKFQIFLSYFNLSLGKKALPRILPLSNTIEPSLSNA